VAPDDRLPFLGLQTLECLFVCLHRFAPNRLLERRLRAIELQTIQVGDIGLSSLAAEFVANAIEHRLPQIRLKRSDTTRLKAFNSLKRLEDGVLDKVVGVCEIARPPGQSSSSPTLERLDMALEQPLQCFLVPCTRAVEQMKGRLGIDEIGRVRIRGFPTPHAVFRHRDSIADSARILPLSNAIMS
jgi:hypothetical protein